MDDRTQYPNMNGRQYFRALARAGLPASMIAAKLGCNLQRVYELKHTDRVPAKYQRAFDTIVASINSTER